MDILEKIKHLFSVCGIVFVLVYNRTQIEEYIRCRYGQGVVADKYLAKFVTISFSLPKRTVNSLIAGEMDDIKGYIFYLVSKFGIKYHGTVSTLLADICLANDLSLRDIEKIISCLALYNAYCPENHLNIECISVGLCFIKVADPVLFNTILNGVLPSYDRVISSFGIETMPAALRSCSSTQYENFKKWWKICAAFDGHLDETEEAMANDLLLTYSFGDVTKLLDYHVNRLRLFGVLDKQYCNAIVGL